MKVFARITQKLAVVSLAPLLMTVLIFQIAFFTKIADYYTSTTCYLIAAVAFFSYYSLFKQTVKYDDELRIPYLEKGGMSFKEKLGFVFKKYEFWTVALFTSALFTVVPLKAFTVAFAGGKTDILSKLKILAFCVPLFVLLGAAATFTAIKDWEKGTTRKKGYSTVAYIEEVAIIAGVYSMGGVVLTMVFPYFSGVGNIFASLGSSGVFSKNTIITIVCIICGIIIIPPAVRTVRGLVKRKAFIKQLKRACKDKGYTLSDIKVPYSSLFSPYAGESFSVKTDRKTYSCKLMCGMRKNVPMLLYENGTGEYIHTLSIGRKGARIEIFRYVKKFNFGYDSENDKVLIVVPVPRFVQMNKAGKIFEMDNGEVIGDYKLFAGTGFINALERECIDGARNKNLYKYI